MDLKMEHVRSILPEWKFNEFNLDAELDEVNSQEAFEAWEKKQKAHHEELRHAFWLDTQDRNCRENCMIASISWIIKLAEQAEREEKNHV